MYDIKYQKIQTKRCIKLANLLLSKFETYLFEEELEVEKQQAQTEYVVVEPANPEEYPPGFFTSL